MTDGYEIAKLPHKAGNVYSNHPPTVVEVVRIQTFGKQHKTQMPVEVYRNFIKCTEQFLTDHKNPTAMLVAV